MRRYSAMAGIAIAPILFIIAILAVLATAIAASTGSFNLNITNEKARALAGAILDDATHVKQAVMRVMALGCSETQLNFGVSGVISGNSSAPADHHCDIFRPEGGGLVFVPMLSDMCSGGSCTRNATADDNVPNVGTSSPDLLWVSYWLDTNVCDQINAMLQRTTNPTNNTLLDTMFTGSYTGSNTFISAYSRISAACAKNGSNYFFYSVLLAR